MFAGLADEIAAVQRVVGPPSGLWQPQRVWQLYPGVQLSIVAIALLSVTASEAAVERTFSAQKLVHSKNRNALLESSVRAEMMIKFNSRTLQGPSSFTFASSRMCIEMTVDASAEDEDAATAVPDAPEPDEQLLEAQSDDIMVPNDDDVDEVLESEPAATRPASSAQQRALRRQPSISFESEAEFFKWFIEELKLTAESRINSNVTIALERHSTKLVNTPGSATLIMRLKATLANLKDIAPSSEH